MADDAYKIASEVPNPDSTSMLEKEVVCSPAWPPDPYANAELP